MEKYIMALDQGTSSSRCIIFDKSGALVSSAAIEFNQIYPQAGYVEHDPNEIWGSQIGAAHEALAKARIKPESIAALGITNQRETVILWDKTTGRPVYNAIVWQCRRTAAACDRLKREGREKVLREKTGLLPNPYFSATKIRWILDNVPQAADTLQKGNLLFGTVDTWLMWNLTGGRVHLTDHSNASRTLLFNIHTKQWDEELLKLFGVPKEILPEVRCSGSLFANCAKEIFGAEIPISGVAGDQQAALFGQLCFKAGMAKNTYGTGCFLLMNMGEKYVESKNGLLTTLTASYNGAFNYALEGSIFIGGAIVKWLRDELELIRRAEESEQLAESVADNNGVYIVPAFVGLGAPYWDAHARGIITGLTRGAGRAHIARAALESMAYQSYDVLRAMQEDSCIGLSGLNVDGGACANDFLLQFQADILNGFVARPAVTETTALGAAYLAGLSVGYWDTMDELSLNRRNETLFSPNLPAALREKYLKEWHAAVKRALSQD